MTEEERAMSKLRLLGQMETIANKFGGTVGGQRIIKEALYHDLVNANPAPRSKQKWLAERIEPMFKCVDERPNWICDPEWPYEDGKPMIFIKQISVSDRDDLRGKLTVDTELYVFGILRPNDDGSLVQVYKVVEQLKDFAGFM